MESIDDLAAEIMEKHNYNEDRAFKELFEMVMNDTTLLKEYTKPLIGRAFREVLQTITKEKVNAND